VGRARRRTVYALFARVALIVVVLFAFLVCALYVCCRACCHASFARAVSRVVRASSTCYVASVHASFARVVCAVHAYFYIASLIITHAN
jgi:hypothetical protein